MAKSSVNSKNSAEAAIEHLASISSMPFFLPKKSFSTTGNGAAQARAFAGLQQNADNQRNGAQHLQNSQHQSQNFSPPLPRSYLYKIQNVLKYLVF